MVQSAVEVTTVPTLSKELLVSLGSLASRIPLLVALDFDGTLAPIVTRPEDARPTPGNLRLVERLAKASGVVVALVSGRSMEDLRKLMAPPDEVVLVGSHGVQGALEERLLSPDEAGLLDGIVKRLEAVSREIPWTRVETKRFSAALHTRPTLEHGGTDAFARARTLTEPLTAWEGVYLTAGDETLEFSVVDGSKCNKGTALLDLVDFVGAAATLYAGDDTTDEDAFEALKGSSASVTVKVTRKGRAEIPTAAGFRVSGPAGVESMLTILVDKLGC